jgi:polysaccharide export outer membrane protein
MDQIKTLILAVLFAGAALVTGCHAKAENIAAWAKPYETNVTADRYVVQPPDELELRCAMIPEINMQRQRIRPDGKISFEVLGEFEVAGKTPEEISVEVGKRVKEHYVLEEEHAVDVRVAVFASHVYYVIGQVARPGPKNFTGRDRTMTAIAEAQPNSMAWQRMIQVVRPAAEEGTEPLVFSIDFKHMAATGDMTKDVLLQDGDVLYVPPTLLAALGLVIEEFISPIARAFYGTYLVQNPPSAGRGYYPGGGGF